MKTKTESDLYNKYEFEMVDVLQNFNRMVLFVQHCIDECNEENLLYVFVLEKMVYKSAYSRNWVFWLKYMIETNQIHSPTLSHFFSVFGEWELFMNCKEELKKSGLSYDHDHTTKSQSFNHLNSLLESPEPKPLRESHSVSSMMNLETIKEKPEYVHITEWFCLAKMIVELFFSSNSPHLLNISNKIKNKVIEKWIQLKNQYEDYMHFYHKPIFAKTEFYTALKHTDSIKWIIQEKIDVATFKWDIQSLFFDSFSEIKYLLQEDVFGRFKRSKKWIQYIHRLSASEIQSFSKPKAVTEIAPYLLHLDDMNRFFITDKDIHLCKLLTLDYYHWKPIYSHSFPCGSSKQEKQKFNIYSSHIQVLHQNAIKKWGHLHTFKICTEFPITAYQFLKMYTDRNFYIQSCELSSIRVIDYISPKLKPSFYYKKKTLFRFWTLDFADVSILTHFDISQMRNSLSGCKWLKHWDLNISPKLLAKFQKEAKFEYYGSTVLHEVKPIFPISTRHFLQTSTIYYDMTENAFYRIFKTCDHPQFVLPSKDVRGTTFGLIKLTEMNSHSCKYTCVFMTNLGGWLKNSNEKSNWIELEAIKNFLIKHHKFTNDYIQHGQISGRDDLCLTKSLSDYIKLLSF